MSKDAYEILGISPDANQTEIDEAYYSLRAQYRNEMYQEGALGKAAARKLTELEQAYQEICSKADEKSAAQEDAPAQDGDSAPHHSAAFAAVSAHVKNKDYRAAQEALDAISVRDAEWHYYQAIIYYNKGWMTEAKNQMEMACNMDAGNQHYQEVLGKLNAAIDNANKTQASGYNAQTQSGVASDGFQRTYQEQDARQSEDMCCRWCQTMICINCLCDCCCRG